MFKYHIRFVIGQKHEAMPFFFYDLNDEFLDEHN